MSDPIYLHKSTKVREADLFVTTVLKCDEIAGKQCARLKKRIRRNLSSK